MNGQHHILAVTQKMLFNNQTSAFVEKGHFISKENNQGEFFLQISEFISNFLSTLGLVEGASHTEIKVHNNEIFIIESHNRVGGDQIPELVAISTGIDLYELAIRQSAGLEIPKEIRKVEQECGILFFDFDEGKVKNIYGIEKLKIFKYLHCYTLSVEAGMTLNKPTNSASRHGYVICKGPHSVKSKLSKASHLVKVNYY